MHIGAMLSCLERGQSASLPHWKADVKLRIQEPQKNSKMTAHYVYVESCNGKVPWTPNQIELLSKEWIVRGE